ncbi:ferredoxin--NADP reductase [Sphingobium sp. YBL2]|uniref:ferredoxin--NADP reductase n=1 Tax=Sphingobium sp. (strain YBL2) TaxID=484429 RepID=UPI0005CBA3EC|nr:ferredoxin--NADP reductase [Sphingobium sp. YBL2]AJR26788.1 adoB [Sphingobium sp. YBL2]
MKKAQTLRIAEVVRQGEDAVLVNFSALDGGAPGLPFVPGQYLTLAANVSGDEHWRCYSIVTDPSADRTIGVLVRRVAGGLVSNWICDHANAGSALRVLPPAGRFRLEQTGRAVLLFAGGSGIAPIFALARQALVDGAPQVFMFYANRDRATAMMMDELKELSQDAGDRLHIRYWYDSEDGYPTPAILSSTLDGWKDADAYLCGPEPFMRLVRAVLQQEGFDPDRVHQEDFGAQDDEDETDTGEGEEAMLAVQVKGQLHEIPVKSGQSLLSAMLVAGLHVPHSCKVGECASCMCRLLEGEVERLDNSVLDEDDVASGWLLACSTRAAGRNIRVRFS